MKRYDAGIQGEQEAENALTRQGMTLRTRRYRAEDGEIDLVMQDGETIVFVEVKARPQSRAGQGMLAVTPAKQRRICHAAMHYLLETGCVAVPARGREGLSAGGQTLLEKAGFRFSCLSERYSVIK